ncbi:Zinc finger protein 536 [Portunus trituberculatus]|uniref:Zinc finger protein 536 n=1 Tax=Portunus trituberculatus TaxID=210409 RepID=A0A5B7CLN1_PORTR|nr:Zinc finger protein 536 [Portunus trituberculatus]
MRDPATKSLAAVQRRSGFTLLLRVKYSCHCVRPGTHRFWKNTDVSDHLHRQSSWSRTGPHSSFLLPPTVAAAAAVIAGVNNNGISEGGPAPRRRQSFSEADLSSALNCPACGKVFAGTKRRYHLERHLITHTGERPFPCPHCPYRANVRENLARHVRHRHLDLVSPAEDPRS